MVGIAAGRFRHAVSFEEPNEVQDPDSGAVEIVADSSAPTGWRTVFENVRAEVNERSVREAVGGGQIQVNTSIVVTVRWRPGFNAKQRIVWQSPNGERVFNIAGVLPDTATGRTFLEIPVVELT